MMSGYWFVVTEAGSSFPRGDPLWVFSGVVRKSYVADKAFALVPVFLRKSCSQFIELFSDC